MGLGKIYFKGLSIEILNEGKNFRLDEFKEETLQWKLPQCPQIRQGTGLCDIRANLKDQRLPVVIPEPFPPSPQSQRSFL